MTTISSERLYQSAWAIVSIYLAILVAGIVQYSMVPLLIDSTMNPVLWWISIPTLVLNLLTAFEAYLWLAPPKDLPLSLPLARFLGVRLVIYLLAVVAQMLLLEACKSTSMSPVAAMTVWASGMSAIIWLYFAYNILGLLWRHDAGAVRKKEYWRAAALYGPFAIAFSVLAHASDYFPHEPQWYGAILAIVATVYFVAYFNTWRGWYLVALSTEGPGNPLSL